MIHLALHALVPLAVALLFFRSNWRWALFLLLATMLVDVDHLLADPIYDPARCSIGFHPLHTTPAIVAYGVSFVVATFARQAESERRWPAVLQLLALGLLIHMGLDSIDCM